MYQFHPLSAAVALSTIPPGMLGAEIRDLQRAYERATREKGSLLSSEIDRYVDGLKSDDNDQAISALLGISSFVESTEISLWRKVRGLYNQHRGEEPSFSWVTTPALGLPTRSQVLGLCRPDSLSPKMKKFLRLCDRYSEEFERWEALYVLDLQEGHFEGAIKILDQMKQDFSKVIKAVAYKKKESVLMGNALLRFGAFMERLYLVGSRFQQPDAELAAWVPTILALEGFSWLRAGVTEMADQAFERGVRHLCGVLATTETEEVYVAASKAAAEFSFHRARTALLNAKNKIYFQELVSGTEILKGLALHLQERDQSEQALLIIEKLLQEEAWADYFQEVNDWEKVAFFAKQKIELLVDFAAVEPLKQFVLLGQAYILLGEASLRLGKSLEALENYLRAGWAWKEAQTLANEDENLELVLHCQDNILYTQRMIDEEVFAARSAKRAALISVLTIAFLEEEILRTSPLLEDLQTLVKKTFTPYFEKMAQAMLRAGFSIRDIQPSGVYRVLQLIDSFELIAPHFSWRDKGWFSEMVEFAAPWLAERRSRFIVRLERSEPDQLVTYRADGKASQFFHGSSEDLDVLEARWQKRHRIAM